MKAAGYVIEQVQHATWGTLWIVRTESGRYFDRIINQDGYMAMDGMLTQQEFTAIVATIKESENATNN